MLSADDLLRLVQQRFHGDDRLALALLCNLSRFIRGATCLALYAPSNVQELGNLVRAVQAMPGIRSHLGDLRSISEEWNAVISHWEALEKSYCDESPASTFPKTTRLLASILP